MNILFYDNGLNTELAIKLAKLGHTVGYCTPWTEAFPKAAKAYIGRGLEGLTEVRSFTAALEKCNCVVCPDTFSADRVAQAAKAGKPVWGAGAAEMLEQDRHYMKSLASATGIPLGPYEAVEGIDALMKALKPIKDVWVKTSKWRAHETFHHKDWESTKRQDLGPILNEFGPVADELEFIIEQPIGGVEIGADCFFVEPTWVKPYGYGYEAKDEAYIGTWTETLPEPLERINKNLERALRSYGCCSAVSTEVRDGKLLEPTVRQPHPPTAGMLEMYDKLDKMYTLQTRTLGTKAKYCAVLVITSSYAGDHWTEIEIKPNRRQLVKLSQACRLDGKYFAVPGNEFVAYAVGIGDSVSAAVKMCKDSAEAVKCKDMGVNPSALDCLMDETIPEGKKKGIFF